MAIFLRLSNAGYGQRFGDAALKILSEFYPRITARCSNFIERRFSDSVLSLLDQFQQFVLLLGNILQRSTRHTYHRADIDYAPPMVILHFRHENISFSIISSYTFSIIPIKEYFFLCSATTSFFVSRKKLLCLSTFLIASSIFPAF